MTNEQNEMIKSASELLAEAVKDKPKVENKPKDDKSQVEIENDRGSRKHDVLTYIEPKYLKSFLSQSAWVSHWAFTYHDKDVWTKADEIENPSHIEGTQKEPHTHIVLYTKDCKTSSAICKLFKRFSVSVYGKDKAQNTRSRYEDDMCKRYRYLTHLDDEEKYQYLLTDIVRDESVYWDKFTQGEVDKPNSGYSMVTDVINGVPYRTMCMKYGKEFIYHSKYIEDVARKIQLEEYVVNSPIDDELIKCVLDASPFYQSQIDDFFKMIDYLKEVFHNEFNNPHGFEIYLKKLGFGE